MTDARPIGVFDSGVGGLTVLQALKSRLPAERTVYLGDTARVPYGTKSPEVVIRYALRNAQFLLQQDIKLLVVACNTVSAVALPMLAAQLPIPVIGVIEPGAQAAVAATRANRVGVLGTPGTIASGAYQRALHALKPDLSVWVQSCPLLVPLAEEGWVDGEVPALVAQRYLAGLSQAQVDTLVLGCTHYPLFKALLAKQVGPSVQLVDSGEVTAGVVAQMLQQGSVAPVPSGVAPSAQYFVTDLPRNFEVIAQRFMGTPVTNAELVDINF